MSVKPFSEIEAEFDLSRFERKWHGKKTKLAKEFWTLACHNSFFSTAIENYSVDDIAVAYRYLFYRPYEAFNWVREHYVGVKTSDIEKVIDFEKVKCDNIKKGEMAMKRVLNIIEEVLISKKDSRALSKFSEINIEDLNEWHPHLRSVSECFRMITCSGAFRGKGSSVLNLYLDLERSHVEELNKAAVQMVRADIILDAIHQIKRQVERQYIFKIKIEVEGATEALDDACLFNPGLMELSDKQIKYYIKNQYCLIGSEDFDSVKKARSLQKAINRQRKKDNE